MSPNPNWPRWIKASIATSFHTTLTPNLFCHLEGGDRRTKDEHSYCEIRIDGPKSNEISKDYWELDITIDVLVNTYKSEDDLYLHERDVGNVLAAFTTDIPVFTYGDGLSDDPNVMLGCLKLLPSAEGSIVTTNFGQVRSDSRLFQSTVEASYRLNLSF